MLREEFDKPYMVPVPFRREKAAGKTIYPPGPMIFNALNSTPLEQVKVVILGQDPYHGPGQAHGLCFSVQPGVRRRRHCRTSSSELKRDLNLDIPQHGYLQRWAEQGVLIAQHLAHGGAGLGGSHAKAGWQQFTDRIIEVVGERRPHLVFMLWERTLSRRQS